MSEQFLEDLKSDLKKRSKPVIQLDRKASKGINEILRSSWKDYPKTNPIIQFLNPFCSSINLTVRNSAKEILPSCSEVNFSNLLSANGIVPSDVIFISGGIGFEPYEIVLTEYFLRNQDEFWLAGSDIGIFDESFSWLIEVGDNGQTLLARKP